jgi:hypothetical protein
VVAFTAQDASGAGIDINGPAASIGSNHLEPIYPLASGANEVDRNDLTRGPGADNGHDIGKAFDFAALMKVARPVMVIVVILRPGSGQGRGQHECGDPQSSKAHQHDFHRRELSHAEAVKPLSIIVSRRQGPRLYQGPACPMTGA